MFSNINPFQDKFVFTIHKDLIRKAVTSYVRSKIWTVRPTIKVQMLNFWPSIQKRQRELSGCERQRTSQLFNAHPPSLQIRNKRRTRLIGAHPPTLDIRQRGRTKLLIRSPPLWTHRCISFPNIFFSFSLTNLYEDISVWQLLIHERKV